MPIQSGESKKSWESTSTLNFSVTLVNHSILTMCTQTHLAISDLPSLPLKLFNSLPKKKKKTQMNVLKATSWEQESYPIPKDLVFVPLLALIFPTVRLFLDRYVFEVNSLPVLSPMLNP